jgi:hypothetical protein
MPAWYDWIGNLAMKQPSTSQATPTPPPGPGTDVDTDTLELLAAWRRQDATNDPDQIRAAEQELAEFKKSVDENRVAAGERKLYS